MGDALIHIESNKGRGMIRMEGCTIDVLDLFTKGLTQLCEEKNITYEKALDILRNNKKRFDAEHITFWVFKTKTIDDEICENLMEKLKKSDDFIDCIDSDENQSKSWLFKNHQAAMCACYIFKFQGIEITTTIKEIHLKTREN